MLDRGSNTQLNRECSPNKISEPKERNGWKLRQVTANKSRLRGPAMTLIAYIYELDISGEQLGPVPRHREGALVEA
jgi:hypothetical protein